MSLLTGRHPSRLGVYINEHALSSDVPTVAHALARAGYETVLCGRMHFIGADQWHGFETRLVGDGSYAGSSSLDMGALTEAKHGGRASVALAGPGDSGQLHYDEAVTVACEQFLRERGTQGRNGRPLFLTVGWRGPHSPYTCPPEVFQTVSRDMEDNDVMPPPDAEPHPYIRQLMDRWGLLETTPAQRRMARANYAGLVNMLDRYVGRVLNACRSLPGETVVIYTSDHGDMAGDRGLFGKFVFYEPAVKVPLLWSWYADYAADVSACARPPIGRLISLADLAPTLAELAGAPALPHVDGESWLAAINGKPMQHDRPIFSELILPFAPPMRMIRQGWFKYVYHHQGQPELFDVEQDPLEQRNLSGTSEYADQERSLRETAFSDWDPNFLVQDYRRKEPDLEYMFNWGKEAGTPPLSNDVAWSAVTPSHEINHSRSV
jgi:choline-sulfatase